MAVTIHQKFIHMAPRKLRLVADLVRGKNVDAALTILLVNPRIASKPVMHAIKSAANAAQAQNVTGTLAVKEIFVDEGPALKRRILKSKGRATKMEHRMSHITVTLDAAIAKPAKPVRAKKPVKPAAKVETAQTEEATVKIDEPAVEADKTAEEKDA